MLICNLVRIISRSSHPEVFLRKAVLKICCKFAGEYLCRNAISVKLQSNFIKIALRHGCSSVNLLHVFRTSFSRNTSGWLFLNFRKELEHSIASGRKKYLYEVNQFQCNLVELVNQLSQRSVSVGIAPGSSTVL